MAPSNSNNHNHNHGHDHDTLTFRTRVLSGHIAPEPKPRPRPRPNLSPSLCHSEPPPHPSFPTNQMRALLDAHNIEDRDWLFNLMIKNEDLFNTRTLGHVHKRKFVSPDYNQPMQQQRDITLQRILFFRDSGVYKGWLTGNSEQDELRKLALCEVIAIFDHSLAIKIGVQMYLWGGAVKFCGSKRHHDKWLKLTEDYGILGCIAMTELGHGSNVRGVETVTTYDPATGEFVVNTPRDSAQKYWIGGAALHANHAVVFSQLSINGENHGVHAFIVPIRDASGNVLPDIRIADVGHKIGLNGIDNGRIWFDNVRIPKENLLNSVADVTREGQYLSAIVDPDQRFAAFLSPLTSGRVYLASGSIYIAKIGLATAIRYALTRRAFSIAPNEPEVLLLDYPSHQRRLLPLLAKTYAMSFVANYLKSIYVERTPDPERIKTIHVLSSALKAIHTWHNMRTLQECREACGGQGLKTVNRVGHLKSEFDVQSTFDGDNNVLMQQVSKALLGEYMAAQKHNKPFKGLWLEHMNGSRPVIPSQLTSSNMRSCQFQTNMFFLRERDLLNLFAAEVAAHLKQGRTKEYAFVLDVLAILRTLYAIAILEEDASFLRYGILSVENAAVVRQELLKLCSELRPYALGLVSAFGIPDEFLGPIAFDWIDVNAWSSVV